MTQDESKPAELGLLEPVPEPEDELRPDRSTGKSDPWHGLDDFED